MISDIEIERERQQLYVTREEEEEEEGERGGKENSCLISRQTDTPSTPNVFQQLISFFCFFLI